MINEELLAYNSSSYQDDDMYVIAPDDDLSGHHQLYSVKASSNVTYTYTLQRDVFGLDCYISKTNNDWWSGTITYPNGQTMTINPNNRPTNFQFNFFPAGTKIEMIANDSRSRIGASSYAKVACVYYAVPLKSVIRLQIYNRLRKPDITYVEELYYVR